MGVLLELGDLNNYRANLTTPLETVDGSETYYFSRSPSSGPILQLMLNILNGYEINESMRLDELTYHRIVEAMKHAYAVRTGLADPNFFPEEIRKVEEKCSNKIGWENDNFSAQILHRLRLRS